MQGSLGVGGPGETGFVAVEWCSWYLRIIVSDARSEDRGSLYLDLVRDPRGMSREHVDQREAWFDGLSRPDRVEVLFELETLLRGLVCFGDTVNHPGPRKRQPAETRRFGLETRICHLTCERIAVICTQLMGPEPEEEPEDPASASTLERLNARLCTEALAQDTPEQSLRLLHRHFSDLADVVGVLTRLDPVPHRGFAGVIRLAVREIERNVFFNPLRLLELRPETDTLEKPELLDVIFAGGPPGAQKAALLSFLTLFRLARTLDLAEAYSRDQATSSLGWVPLSAVRAVGEALVELMRGDAQRWLAAGFEDAVRDIPASQVVVSMKQLEAEYLLLHELGSMLLNLGDQLGLEIRRAFEQTMAPIQAQVAPGELLERRTQAIRDLREFQRYAVVTLANVFDPQLPATRLFDEGIEARSQAERIRRDIWIFTQILRALLAKAAAAPETANRWTGTSSYRFVRDFIAYFRTLGFHLLRAFDYPRSDEFMSLVEALSSADVLEQDFIEAFERECELFRDFLQGVFEAVSRRDELAGIEFDRHGAAETLRLYLDRS